MAAKAQEDEIGDATNLVVVFAGVLLEHAEVLLRQVCDRSNTFVSAHKLFSIFIFSIIHDFVLLSGPPHCRYHSWLHHCYQSLPQAFRHIICPQGRTPSRPTRPFAPSSTPFGSESAWQAGLKAKPWALNPQVDDFKNEAEVTAALRSAIAAKQYGLEGVLAPLVARACIQILPKDPTTFNVDNVRCVKIPGMTVNDSYLMKVLHVDGHRTKFGPCRSLPSTDESEDRRSDHASVEESGI